MKKLLLIAKGFVIGLANIIPGVSGGTLALILGIYEKLLNAISSIFKKFKENFVFLLLVGIGLVAAVLLGSIGIEAALENYKIATTLFFIGLIVGGMPILFKKVKGKINYKNIIVFVIVFAIMMVVTFVSGTAVKIETPTFFDYIKMFVMGVIASGTMVIPGVSGSMVLMSLGYYDLVIGCVASITDFTLLAYNMQILIPFGIGVVVGIVFIAKIILILLNKFEVQTYFAIFGFIIASFVGMIYLNIKTFDLIQFIVGFILMIAGAFATYKLSTYEKKDD